VQGIIDTGYRGELFSAVWNLTSQPVVVTKGDRIAQFIILPNETQNTLLVRSEALGDSERGLGGFGSSGA
jgi:dUTP pyrophosphatase